MDLLAALERDTEGRLPVVEIVSSRIKTLVRACLYAAFTLVLMSGGLGLFGIPIGLITGAMSIRYLCRALIGRTLVISEDGIYVGGVLRRRALPWSTIKHFKLVKLNRVQWLSSFIWCFRTDDVPYRDRFVSIGNGWKQSPLALFSYLEWYQAKVRGDESRSDLADDVVRMNLMTEIGMNRAFAIIAVLIGGTGLLAYLLVMLLRAVRGH